MNSAQVQDRLRREAYKRPFFLQPMDRLYISDACFIFRDATIYLFICLSVCLSVYLMYSNLIKSDLIRSDLI